MYFFDTNKKLVTTSFLKGKGWTTKMINKFLKHKKAYIEIEENGELIKYFRTMFIKKLATSEDFIDYVEELKIKSNKKTNGLNGYGKHRARIIKNNLEKSVIIDDIIIDFSSVIQEEKLYKTICRAYNSHYKLKVEDKNFLTLDSSKKILNKVAVNYLKHSKTNYNKQLNNFCWNNDFDKNYSMLKLTILNTIGKTYPFLNKECKIQRLKLYKHKVINRNHYNFDKLS